MREIRMIEAIDEAICEEMEKDERIVVYGEDVGLIGGPFGATVNASKKYFNPDPTKSRVLDTPISETAIIGSAIGAAIAGLRPIVEIGFIDFTGCAMEEFLNQMAKLHYMFGGQAKIPVVFRTSSGAGLRNAAQHSQSLEGLFLHIPGLKIVLPSNPEDAKGLLKTAIRDDDPVIIIEHRTMYGVKGPVPEKEYLIPLGEAKIKKEGKDVTLVATSMMVNRALKAAEELDKEGISVEVIDPRTIFPLDKKTIMNSIHKTHRFVVVEEAVRRAGFSAELVATIAEEAFSELKVPPKRIGALETPVPFSPVLEDYYLPDENDIIKVVKEILY